MRAEDLQIRRAGKKAASRASPGINVAFPDLVSEGDVRLQALVELNQRQLPGAAKVFMEKIMSNARYYVVGDHDVWMIKFKDGEYGPCASRDEAFVFAIDAAQKLGTWGECAHVCVVDDDGRFQSKWTYDRDHHLRRSAS
jgi:hypothetical protein